MHVGHNATLAVMNNDKFHILELDRLFGLKNLSLAGTCCYDTTAETVVLKGLEILQKVWGIENNFDLCLISKGYEQFYDRINEIKKSICAGEFQNVDHHLSHASGAFCQSVFDKSLVISCDGWGNDGTFNFYLAERGKPLEIIGKYPQSLGDRYGWCGFAVSEIQKKRSGDSWSNQVLEFSGKLMGLGAYGTVRSNWIDDFEQYYITVGKAGDVFDDLLKKIGNSFSGQDAYDFAATNQYVFENVFLKLSQPYLDQYKLPICFSGGCAMNVLLNSKLSQIQETFVPPNPNDSGIAFGMLMAHLNPINPIDGAYLGPNLLGDKELGHKTNNKEIATLLASGKIVGVARGRAECGPRALGNRSILCNPTQGMKENLNERIKHREWFRPFGPIVKKDQIGKYFDLVGESPYMSFVGTVKLEWRSKLAAITHQDMTARIQTVNEGSWLYELLTEFEAIVGHGVLLNTSFNMKGRPIVSSVDEATTMLDQTELDFAVIEDRLLQKGSKCKKPLL